MRVRRTGEIGPMGLLPGVWLGRIQWRRHVLRMVQPAMPRRRHFGGLGEPVIDHPPALESENRIDLAATGAVIAIAKLVRADELAVEFRPHLRPEGLAVPPGEKAQQKSLHRRVRRSDCRSLAAGWCHFAATMSREAR